MSTQYKSEIFGKDFPEGARVLTSGFNVRLRNSPSTSSPIKFEYPSNSQTIGYLRDVHKAEGYYWLGVSQKERSLLNPFESVEIYGWVALPYAVLDKNDTSINAYNAILIQNYLKREQINLNEINTLLSKAGAKKRAGYAIPSVVRDKVDKLILNLNTRQSQFRTLPVQITGELSSKAVSPASNQAGDVFKNYSAVFPNSIAGLGIIPVVAIAVIVAVALIAGVIVWQTSQTSLLKQLHDQAANGSLGKEVDEILEKKLTKEEQQKVKKEVATRNAAISEEAKRNAEKGAYDKVKDTMAAGSLLVAGAAALLFIPKLLRRK